jgi:hypothetical protein
MNGTQEQRRGDSGQRGSARGRPPFGRFTRQEAVLGLAALGLFYWGSVATLVGYRLDRAVAPPQPCFPRRPPPARHWRFVPDGQYHRDWIAPEPAWAPYPRPRVLGLAQGRPDVLLADFPGR